MIGCRADGLRSLRERYAVVARRACEKPISRRGKRVNDTLGSFSTVTSALKHAARRLSGVSEFWQFTSKTVLTTITEQYTQ